MDTVKMQEPTMIVASLRSSGRAQRSPTGGPQTLVVREVRRLAPTGPEHARTSRPRATTIITASHTSHHKERSTVVFPGVLRTVSST